MMPLHKGLLMDHEYSVIEVEGGTATIANAYDWCTETFGPAGTRWFYNNCKFYFTTSKDAMWFELKY